MTRGALLPALAGLLLLLGLPASTLAAQQAGGATPSAAAAPGTAPAKPSSIPLAQISSRSDAVLAELDRIEAQRPTDALEGIGERLAAAEQAATAVEQRIDAVLARSHNPTELDAAGAGWDKLDAELEALQDQIGNQAQILDGRLSSVADQTQSWQLTLQEARRLRAPSAVRTQIEQVLSALAAAKKTLGSDLAATLALQERVRTARGAVDPIGGRIEAAKKALAAGLLVRQDEPIWHGIPSRDQLAAAPEGVAASLAGAWADGLRYMAEHRDRVIVQGLLALVLAWFFSGARRGEEPPSEAGAPPAADPLRHPWAAAVLVAFLATPWLHPERVAGFQMLLVPVALVAWLRVLSGMLDPALLKPMACLGLLALVELVRFVVHAGPLVERLLLLLDLGAALGGIVWLRRPQRLQHVPWRGARGPWVALASGWMRLLPAALGAGLIATLLGYTNLADRVAVVSIWGTVAGTAWLALVGIVEALATSVIEGDRLPWLRMIGSARDASLRVVRRGLRGLGVLAWSYATLSLAGLWDPVRAALGSVLGASVGYGAVSVSLGGVLAFGLALWLSWLLARFVSFALDQEVFSRVRLAPGVPYALSTFSRYAILVVGFAIAMGAVGFSIDRLTLVLSAVGVGIGFGLQNAVNNFVSGLILLFERPIRVGDWIQVDELFGIVSSIGIRASKVRTFDGSDVIVPNGDLVSARVINWTLSDRTRRIILPVGVAYGTAPRKVLELLEEVARANSQVLADPRPQALFRGFGDSSLNFELRAFTDEDFWRVTSDLAVGVSEALEAAGIQIPFPQRDLHLRNVDELREALKEVVGPAGRSDDAGS